MIASHETVYDPNWYIDSGASSHITPEAHNLMAKNEYSGQELVHVGNGAGLEINSIGHSFIKTSHSNHVLLHNLWMFPKLPKFSCVSKFCKDNSVFFEFHPDFCCVKSQVTKQILLEGTVKDGLYMFDKLNLSHLATSSYLNANTTALSTVSPKSLSSSCTLFGTRG